VDLAKVQTVTTNIIIEDMVYTALFLKVVLQIPLHLHLRKLCCKKTATPYLHISSARSSPYPPRRCFANPLLAGSPARLARTVLCQSGPPHLATFRRRILGLARMRRLATLFSGLACMFEPSCTYRGAYSLWSYSLEQLGCWATYARNSLS
jgi:hypothetical protein